MAPLLYAVIATTGILERGLHRAPPPVSMEYIVDSPKEPRRVPTSPGRGVTVLRWNCDGTRGEVR